MANNQKSFVKLAFDKEKLSAVQTFLERKNLKLEEEFEQFFETLFKKHVPKDVQIYIESMSSSSPKAEKKSSKKSAHSDETNTKSQENSEVLLPRDKDKIVAEKILSIPEKGLDSPSVPNRFDRFKD